MQQRKRLLVLDLGVGFIGGAGLELSDCTFQRSAAFR